LAVELPKSAWVSGTYNVIAAIIYLGGLAHPSPNRGKQRRVTAIEFPEARTSSFLGWLAVLQV
jgi:hypothetical protein